MEITTGETSDLTGGHDQPIFGFNGSHDQPNRVFKGATIGQLSDLTGATTGQTSDSMGITTRRAQRTSCFLLVFSFIDGNETHCKELGSRRIGLSHTITLGAG